MKLGIVFEGGASRTFFSCGVMDTLIEHNIKADLVSGSSAGIANAVSYTAWQKGRNREVLRRYYHTKQYMGKRYLLKPGVRSFYNIPYVFDEIPNRLLPLDYDTFKNGGIKTVAAVTNIRTAVTEYMPLNGEDKQWRILVASCALPILFKPVEINGELYMDGGITDSVPVDYMLEAGCDRVIAVLTREKGYRKSRHDITLELSAHIFRKYKAFARALLERNENYNRKREHIARLESEGRVLVIAPEVMEGISRTENDPQKLDKIYRHGIDVAERLLPRIKEYIGE